MKAGHYKRCQEFEETIREIDRIEQMELTAVFLRKRYARTGNPDTLREIEQLEAKAAILAAKYDLSDARSTATIASAARLR